MSQTYIPPLNFGIVEEDLYRAGQPNELNFPFMEKLNLKKVIWLAPEEPVRELLNFVDDHDIDLLHLGKATPGKSAYTAMSEEPVLEALQVILDPSSYPLMVMCNLGRHRTGTLVGCLRKLQRWNLTSIFDEYRRYAGSKVRLMNEQFIEFFDTDLVRIPVEHPAWLCGCRHAAHCIEACHLKAAV